MKYRAHWLVWTTDDIVEVWDREVRVGTFTGLDVAMACVDVISLFHLEAA